MARGSQTGPDPIDVEVGRRLAARRTQLGYTQADLGRAIGVTFQQVQKYEKGSNRISASMLVRSAEFLQTTPAFFLPTKEDVAAGPDDVAHAMTSRHGREVAQLYAAMPPHQQASVLSVVRAIAQASAVQAAIAA